MVNNKVLLFYALVVLGVVLYSTDALDTTTADYTTGTADYTVSDATAAYTTATTTDPPTVAFTTTDPHTTAASTDATSIPATDNTTATVMDTTTTTAMNYTTSTTTTPLITNSTIDVSTTSPATITTTSATTTSPTNSTNTSSTPTNTTDPCYSDPCGDNGTCTTLSEYPYYKCECQPPYIGDNCTQDACYQQACEKNGGQCEVISDEPFYTCPCYLPQLGTYFCAKERIFIIAIPLGGLLFLVIVIILIACHVRKRRYRKSAARKIDVEEALAIPLSSMEQTNPSIATNNSENSTTNEKSEDPEKKIGDHEEGVEDVEANAVILLVEEAINTGNDEVSTEPNSLNDNEIEPTATVTSKETGIQNQTASKETPEQGIEKGEEKEKLEKQHKNSIVPTSTTASKESEYPKKDIPTEDMSESDVVNEENNSLQASPATSKDEGDVTTTHEAVQTEATKSDVSYGKDVKVEGSEKMDVSTAALKADENIVATDVEVKQTSNKGGKIDEEEKGPIQQNISLTKKDGTRTTTSTQEISPPMTIDFELRQKAVVKEEENEEEEEEKEKEDEEEEEGSVKSNIIVTAEGGITDNTSQMSSINDTNTGETNSEPPKFLAETSATETNEISKANEEGKRYLEANKSPISEEVKDEDVEAVAVILETGEKMVIEDVRRQSNPVTSTDEVTSLTTSIPISQRTDVDASIDTTATQKVVKIDEEANETHKNELENSPNDVVNSTSSSTTTKSNQAATDPSSSGEEHGKVETVTELKDISPTSPTAPADEDGVDTKKNEQIDDSHQIVRSRLSSVLRNEVKSAATKLNPITEVTKPDITDEEKKNMQQDADGNWHYQTVRNFWEATTSESHATNSTAKSSGDQTIKEPPPTEDENDQANQPLKEH